MDTFPNNLKRLRKAAGLKQEELAEKLNVTRQTVSGWETGRRQPDLDTLKDLAAALDADVYELIYGDKPGEYPRFQRKYVVWTAVCGGIVAVLALFRLLIWPWLRVLCNTYWWTVPIVVNYYYVPPLGSFAAGALIPALQSLSMPVRVENRWRMVCLITGVIFVAPVFLVWVRPFGWLWAYDLSRSIVSYILPFLSGILIFLGLNRD